MGFFVHTDSDEQVPWAEVVVTTTLADGVSVRIHPVDWSASSEVDQLDQGFRPAEPPDDPDDF